MPLKISHLRLPLLFTLALVFACLFCAAARTAEPEKWFDLFDGKTLTGWTPRSDAKITVVDGEIHIESKTNVWVVTDRKLTDFVLEVEVKVAEGDHVNSGIAFRCQGEKGKPRGYQCEIDASTRAWTGGLHAIGKGWIYPDKESKESIESFLAQSKGSFHRQQWNHFRIHCQGDRIRIYTNGVLTTDLRDQLFREGFVGIQHHGGGGVNKFRKIRYRQVSADSSANQNDIAAQAKPTAPAKIDFATELPRIPPTEPADALATFRLQPGFAIELVAAEPLIRDPVAIDFDEDGRMFVVEFPEYNQKHVRKKITDHGRVRVLEDTDSDGVYDRSEIYVDHLSYPSSVACYDGGVFVSAAPEILYCKDTDGDNRADIRKVVYTGFGQEFQRAGQAQLNSFRWGLDNRFHVCTSFSGGAILRPDSKQPKPVGVRNRGFLFDPRTLQYEAVSGGGQNGLAIDDWGREFRCRNSDPFKLLIYDDRYLARNPYLKAPAPSVNILASGKNTQLDLIKAF